jgi:hypothetical protein
VFLAAIAPTPVFDSSALLRRISALGSNTGVGWRWPLVGTVRDALGDDVADAYASAGTDRLSSDDDTTRSIAERDFAKALTQYAAMPETPRLLVASAPEARRIADRGVRPESIATVIRRALPSPASPASSEADEP